jgi:hypothetical protein
MIGYDVNFALMIAMVVVMAPLLLMLRPPPPAAPLDAVEPAH